MHALVTIGVIWQANVGNLALLFVMGIFTWSVVTLAAEHKIDDIRADPLSGI